MTRPLTQTADRRPTQFCDADHPPVMRDDALAVEEPLEIRIASPGGEPIPLAITMRTPGHDDQLAAGFVMTEGIVAKAHDIESVEPCRLADYGNIVTVTLADAPGSDAERTADANRIDTARRELYLSSSCGLCGKQTLDRIEQHVEPIVGNFSVTRETLDALPRRMRAAQATFDATGGLHAAALFTPEGDLIVLREDVGRHNAVDKVIGHELLLGRTPIDRAVLLVSGRSSFEIVQKAAVAGIAVLAAVSAPSTLAVDAAQRLNITLIGFLRDRRLNIYTHAHRVK